MSNSRKVMIDTDTPRTDVAQTRYQDYLSKMMEHRHYGQVPPDGWAICRILELELAAALKKGKR